MRKILVVGASRGLGAALVAGLPRDEDEVWGVSRTAPTVPAERQDRMRWIQTDLRQPSNAAQAVGDALGESQLDLLIYNAGIWELGSFDDSSDEELIDVLNVNLVTLVLCLRRLLPNLRRAAAARVILIGSTSGLDNEGSSGVAYVASKFGMRGVAHAARELLRQDSIGVTCISPGSLASDVPLELGVPAAVGRYGHKRIPLEDVVKLVRCICDLSPAACPKEVTLPALLDTDV